MRRPLMLLADASAYVDEFPFHHAGVNRAIIELRRAEVALVSVHAQKWFRTMRQEVFNFGRDAVNNSLQKLVGALRHNKGDKEVIDGFRQASASESLEDAQLDHVLGLLYDALYRLDQAEDELRQHPKNRWWWWILCVLKTRLAEYMHVVRVARVLRDKERLNPIIPLRIHRYHRWEVFSDIDTRLIRDPFRLARLIASQEAIIICEILYYNIRVRSPRMTDNSEFERLMDSGRRLKDLIERTKGSLAALPEAPNEFEKLKLYVETCCERSKGLMEVLLSSDVSVAKAGP